MRKTMAYKSSVGTAFLMSLGFNTFLGILCILFLCPHFRTNDDMIIHLITSGAYGIASEYTGFVNILLSKLLVVLQALVPSINHFAVLQFGLIIIALSLFDGLIISKFNSHTSCVMAVCLSFLTLFRLSEIHYTATAFIISSLGFACVLVSLHGSRINKFAAVGGALVAVTGSMLRFNAFFLAAAFCFIPFVASFFDGKKKILKALSFAAIFATAIAANMYNSACYETNPLTAGWLDFCEDRQQISDYALPSYSARYIEYMQLGLSENDFELIDSWLYADRGIFPAETIDAIAEIGSTATVGQKLWFSTNDLKQHLPHVFTYAFILTTASFLLFCHKKSLLFLLEHISILIAAVAFCLLLGRITAWVLYGIMVAFTVGTVVIVLMYCGNNEKAAAKIAVSCTIATAVLALCIYDCSGGPLKDYKNGSFYSVFEQAADKYSNDVLLCTDIGILSQHMASVFEGVPAGKFENIYVLGGWDDSLPAKTHLLRKNGITSPYLALAQHSNVLLMDKENLGTIVNAIYEHYGYHVGFSVIDMLGGYRVIAATDSAAFGATAEEKIKINDAAMFASYLGADVTSVCVSSDRHLRPNETAYIRLAEQGKNDGKIYRCKSSDEGSDLYEIVILNIDTSAFADYTAQLLIVSEDGNRCVSDSINLQKQ